jgi:RNA polymerase sigma factor (sigma-70 family)
MARKNIDVEFTLWLKERQISLLRAARVICFDAQNAEDVLQEALADVYERWQKVKEHENPEAYVMRVMVSKHADMRRKWLRKQQSNETSWELAENIRAISDQSDDVAQRLLVQSALKTLSGTQRAVLVLVYEYGLVLREVAKILELPVGTVASHLARGKAAVAAHLELIPEFERSIRNEITGSKERREIVFGEVVDE